MRITSTKTLELKGRGQVSISANDHVATGGEGSIYRLGKSSTIVKLFTDPRRMLDTGLAVKLDLLSKIKHPYIVSPSGLVLDHGNPIGYYMPHIEGVDLPCVFTTSWQRRENFDRSAASTLVERMRQVVQVAHGAQALMVDPNELNWLVIVQGANGPEPRVLDVDSWSIGSWQAKVIMPSIRDWHATSFSTKTDWFSWGVITFQVYTGTHPYQGTLAGYNQNEMERRMRENASVFEPGVRLHKTVRDFNGIPGPLLDWYVATFKDGERTLPPSPFDTATAITKVATITHVTVTASGSLVYDKLFADPNDSALTVFGCGVVLLKSGRLIDLATKQIIGKALSNKCEVARQENGWLKADYDAGKPIVSYIDGVTLQEELLSMQFIAHRFVRYENRMFAVTEQGLTEMSVSLFGKKALLLCGSTWEAMFNSTRWYDGVGIQDAMGATYVITPFAENACVQMRVRELDGLRPVAAKSGNRFVAIIVVDKLGAYRKIELTFNREYTSYTIWEGVTDTADLNMALLPKGVATIITEDGELNIFVPTTATLKQVADRQISTDMVLANWNDTVVYIHHGAVWSVRMR